MDEQQEQDVRSRLEADYTEVLDTKQMQEKYEVSRFIAPLVIVIRKEDNKRGSLEFTHMPRFYFNFMPYDE